MIAVCCEKVLSQDNTEAAVRVAEVDRNFKVSNSSSPDHGLGDRVNLNLKRFNKFEAVDGRTPWDHHFINYTCCYLSCYCVCLISNVEKELGKLQRELKKKEGSSNGVIFFVRTYNEIKELMRGHHVEEVKHKLEKLRHENLVNKLERKLVFDEIKLLIV
ncbi:hypothetical protein Bca4012_064276 [Brassica carinata]|uniref:Uncharacterized protein n=1 Tax=Brassica carinata TaxID=52824 RepID=A0A8X7SER9_BRACI|nr:hypothetical protein Bca52824_033861 [Brassica carinata]